MNTHSQTRQTRFNWIDQIKGLAILAIVIFHFFQNYPARSQLISVLDSNGAKLGYAAVDIFFLMAGFNTSYALISKLQKNQIEEIKINWKSWLLKRLYRIYPAYILAVILTCLLYLLVNIKINLNLNFFLSFIGIAGIRFQSINPGFWFFTVILEAYLLTPLIFLFCKTHQNKILILGLIGAIITKLLAFYFLINHHTNNYLFFLQDNFIGSYLFQFCLGLYWGIIYAKHQIFRKTDLIVSSILFSLGFIIYAILTIFKIKYIYMLGIDMLFTPLFFFGIQALLSHLAKIAKIQHILSFFSILGIYSYQIYLIHQPLYFVLLPKLNYVIQINNYLKIGVSLIIVSILLAIYVFSFIRIERFLMKMLGTVMNKQN
ncbi:MAG: acyltransferase [Nostoc sp. NMS7]|uniref:acyltransferase family protein n=1 Tax=Nostoc sp. NMS7 TaxID=2815391 RepID=UPI0025F61915|nr:acyltransferase [Nostoc sp. NMS7]MBN3951813.1 acyltransferase [Nostoc sp. NMS7]